MLCNHFISIKITGSYNWHEKACVVFTNIEVIYIVCISNVSLAFYPLIINTIYCFCKKPLEYD